MERKISMTQRLFIAIVFLRYSKILAPTYPLTLSQLNLPHTHTVSSSPS